jgi:hypothetical protein
MKYILDEDEYKALVNATRYAKYQGEKALVELRNDTDSIIQELCTMIADNVYIKENNEIVDGPIGCILNGDTYNNNCDGCLVISKCPFRSGT